MKKFLSLLFLLIAAGWAVYVFGVLRGAAAAPGDDVLYQSDPKLPEFVQRLQSMQTRMREQIDALDHADKKASADPRGELPPKPLRDPFSGTF